MNDLVQPSDVSLESLQALYDGAFMQTQIDEHGNLYVLDRFRCYVNPIGEGRRIHLFALFKAAEGASDDLKLRFANRVNDTLILVRATMDQTGFCFDTYIPVDGGIAPKAVILATRAFMDLVKDIGQFDTDGALA